MKRWNFKKSLIGFVRGKAFDYLIIILVLFYTGLIFAYFALDIKDYEDINTIQDAINIL